jgi:hypothetical protein
MEDLRTNIWAGDIKIQLLKKYDVKVWTALTWFSIGTCSEIF